MGVSKSTNLRDAACETRAMLPGDGRENGRGGVMTKTKDAAAEFLSKKRIAVTGVSRSPGDHGSNVVYKRLRQGGTRCSPSTRTRVRHHRDRWRLLLMFNPTSDAGHKVMRFMFTMTGRVPRQV